jgi:hypothetical protein
MKLDRNKRRIRTWVILLSGAISVVLSFTIYLLFIQSPLVSKRELFAAFLVFLALLWPVYLLLNRFLIPTFRLYTPKGKFILLFSSFLFGLFITFFTNHSPIYFLLPKHSLTISVPPASGLTAESHVVSISWFSDGWQDVSFSQFVQTGNWQKEANRIFLIGSSGGSLEWKGRINGVSEIEFEAEPQGGNVEVIWDGKSASYDLTGETGKKVVAAQTFADKNQAHLAAGLALFLSSFFVFLIATLFFLNLHIPETKPRSKKRFSWLIYAIPMIAVWCGVLYVIYPGLVAEDSWAQWLQVVTGQYSDHHPILYALVMGLADRIYPFPASTAIFQVLIISFSLAWGLDEFENMRVPRKFIWSLTAILTLLPINILSSLAIVKDIPYSVSVLILSIIIMKVVNSQGKWLTLKLRWLLLGVTLASITLFRINGLPVAIGSYLLLLVFYRFTWKRIAAAGGVFVLCLALMYGPIYSALRVKHEPEFGTILFLHHIAAHLEAGTPLTAEQETYINQLAPINSWNYDCCQANPTMLAVFPGILKHEQGLPMQNYDVPILRQDINKPARIAFELFLKDPKVDISHMFCASQIIWSLGSSCRDRTNLDTIKNDSNLTNSNIAPEGLISLVKLYLPIYPSETIHNPNLIMAIYLYIAIYCLMIFSVRTRIWKMLLYLSPILIQSAFLTLINISQAYRYQYGIVLIGILSIGFLFVPIFQPHENHSSDNIK